MADQALKDFGKLHVIYDSNGVLELIDHYTVLSFINSMFISAGGADIIITADSRWTGNKYTMKTGVIIGMILSSNIDDTSSDESLFGSEE